jgi:predicted nucleic acid-binding Zn ribbon protein
MTIHIKEILKKIIDGRPSISKSVNESRAADLWGSVVEGEAQRNTEPLKVKDGTLYVIVSSSTWAQEFQLKKSEVLEKINGLLGDKSVLKDIRFKTGLIRRR